MKYLAIVICVFFWVLVPYVGIYLMFYGGIVNIVDAVQIQPIPGYLIALGIVKIVFASSSVLIGYIPTLLVGLYYTTK